MEDFLNNTKGPASPAKRPKNMSIIVASIGLVILLSLGYMWLAFEIIGL